MRQFSTTTVEQRKVFREDFDTHPMEAAWAVEAIFFIHAEEISGKDTALTASVQISFDGVHWVDEGTAFTSITTTGIFFVKVKHFGGWLRLAGNVNGTNPEYKLTIHLVLKE